jgi:hypothetical protein
MPARRKVAGVQLQRSIVGWTGRVNGRITSFRKNKKGTWSVHPQGRKQLPCKERTLRRAVTCAKTYTYSR